MRVNTATGAIPLDQLGRTLMHEHLVVGLAGWESDTAHPGPSIREMIAICVDKAAELKDAGFSTLLDPCPNDLGRDVRILAETADRAGFNIIFATGLYHEALGATAYWRAQLMFDPDGEKRLADLFIRELTEGVGDTGIRAGVIKVATGLPPISAYEQAVFRAAATASLATGAPITTHTDAVLGEAQLELLTGLGVPAHRIIIGHSCGSPDHDYHMQIVDSGAYIGFDRFGYEVIQSDEVRVESLLKLLAKGAGPQVVISHDCVWCHRGRPPAAVTAMEGPEQSLRFTRVIAPRLKAAGVTEAQIDALLIDNPRRYFAGEPPPARAAKPQAATVS